MRHKALFKQKALRPTTGKVKEALFDILRGKIENARFLDLYAGTGAVGINALKEGAAAVIFVDESRRHTKRIDDRIKRLHLPGKATVMTKKVLSYIDWAELNHLTFDIIFLDPPYHTDEILYALSAIAGSNIMSRNAIVVAEHFTQKKLPDSFDRLQKTRDYTYGDSVLSFFEAAP